MRGPLTGKKAIVCGASQGIGRACAVELSKLGAAVTLVARDGSTLQKALADLSTEGGLAHDYLVADFSDPASLSKKISAHVQAHGECQILVNNTGGPPHGAIIDAAPEDFLKAFSNHVVCNQLLVQALLPGMKRAGYGRIINIISTSVIAPIRGLGVSNTTRGAVAQWARSLAAEVAPFGITVNNILPGYTATHRLDSLFKAKAEKQNTTIDAVRQAVIDAIPAKRLGDPSEIGAVVAFLATPAASYVNGINLPVDGGRTAAQ